MTETHSNEEVSSLNERVSLEDSRIDLQSAQPLTAELLAEQNELTKVLPKPNAIRAWAADLPQAPDSVQPVLTSSHVFEMDTPDNGGKIHETKDVFTETQKVAYVGLCYLTSLEVVHDYQGKEFALARMSADNWQRKLMRMLYAHMDISKEEIKMIESLSKHSILPTDLVHQFTAQGDTAEIKLDDFFKNNSTTMEDKVIIDLRWTVVCDLFLICLSTENYDARSRVFVARITSYLSLDWFQVVGFEKRIAEHLLLQDASWETETVNSMATTVTNMTMTNAENDGSIKSHQERHNRNKQRKKRRYVMVGLATIGGGLILGLSAGLMAPMIAGGIGVLLSTVGVTGTAGFLGGTAGVALITGGATVAGGRIGGKGMSRRMKSIDTFDFLPVYTEENVNCIITITGWLPNTSKEEASLPFSTLDHLMGDHYTLYWEPEMLEELGSAFKILATEAVTFSIQQALAHTIMGALLAGLAWPLALTKLGYMVDNPWANALDRSKVAGLVLADVLMNRNLGARPITLVGFSLGARTIFYCLLELARMKAFGLVENVILFGTPVSASEAQWKECTTVVSGRFVNGYATNDWLLGFLFRTSTAGLGNIAGLRPLLHIEGNRVQNLDCTDLITGHLSYRTSMPKLLKRAGFVVTSEELPVLKEKSSGGGFTSFIKSRSSGSPTEKDDEIDVKNKYADSMKVTSSLSSGKASIQIIPKTQSSEPINNNRNSSSTEIIPTPSTSTIPSSSSSSHEKKETTDCEIIADIIANATAAASSKSGSYSSLSSGKASITTRPRRSTLNSLLGRSRSEPISIANTNKRQSTNSIHGRSSLMFGASLFGNKKKVEEDPVKKELKDAGVEIKEIKSTLGCLVVPKDVSDPMPQVKLELPQHALLNR
ncbi:hypothetical protein G6F43_003211 [Rhizopus delemar]|nr:hypothetical protein G6F43_003211 [Rhizopus delemar]